MSVRYAVFAAVWLGLEMEMRGRAEQGKRPTEKAAGWKREKGKAGFF